jgi:hypothetical protein
VDLRPGTAACVAPPHTADAAGQPVATGTAAALAVPHTGTALGTPIVVGDGSASAPAHIGAAEGSTTVVGHAAGTAPAHRAHAREAPIPTYLVIRLAAVTAGTWTLTVTAHVAPPIRIRTHLTGSAV